MLQVPSELYARAFAPVVPALCACTHPETTVSVRVNILPSRGEVRVSAPDDADVDACLVRELAPGKFAPMDLDGSDCISCGPHHLAAPARPAALARHSSAPSSPLPTPATTSNGVASIVLPLVVDRQRQRVLDASHTHVPEYVQDRRE